MNLLGTNQCECGVKLCGKHIKPPLMNPADLGIRDKNFYGGRVKKIANATCDCGKEYLLLLKPINNGYEVVDIATKSEMEFNLEIADHAALILKAKELRLPGNVGKMKPETLREKIKEKLEV